MFRSADSTVRQLILVDCATIETSSRRASKDRVPNNAEGGLAVMERVWTEKEPLVPEWYDHKEDKKDQADGMPKLSMKLLYGMIQELKQCSERLNARLDDFEHYMIEVQATRAQLEADAARTLARAKAVAARHDSITFPEMASAIHGHGQAVDADAETPPMHEAPHNTTVHVDQSIKTGAAEEHPPALEANLMLDQDAACADESAVAAAIAIADETIAAVDSTEIVSLHSSEVEELTELSLMQTDDATSAINIDAIPLHTKPSKLESQPGYLMSLAQEVMGFTSPESDAEDGIDPGEGANPFDPDSFAVHHLETAEAQAAPAAALPAASHNTAAAMTSPFFAPRSQRHQTSKKTFLSLFGFRTRIS